MLTVQQELKAELPLLASAESVDDFRLRTSTFLQGALSTGKPQKRAGGHRKRN